MIARLAAVVAEATDSFEDYDYARALERDGGASSGGTATTTSSSSRAAATTPAPGAAASVSRALRLSLSVFQRLLAPFLPFVAEEVWSWWQEGSVHRAQLA